MNKEKEELERYGAMVEQAQLQGQAGQAAQAAAAAQYYVQEQEKNLAETQLEVDSILSEIYHLLKQDIYKDAGDGRFEWVALPDQKQRALTDWGVDRIMQVMKFYINKNTLLSNFDDKQIARRMLKFMLAMNGLLLMKYEFLFRQPSFEECKEILLERMDERKKLKKFTIEIIGKTPNEKQIEEEILKEIEWKIEREMEKIKQEKRRQNLREYELILTQLEAMVESTHNRAWKGEERGSIRRHTNIHEILGGRPPSQQERGGLFKWIKS